jgi:hypothetical protein
LVFAASLELACGNLRQPPRPGSASPTSDARSLSPDLPIPGADAVPVHDAAADPVIVAADLRGADADASSSGADVPAVGADAAVDSVVRLDADAAVADAVVATLAEVGGVDREPIDSNGGAAPRSRAILVSVDGLGAYYLRQQLDQGNLPNFAALKRNGLSTLNARSDYDYTVTLPNHVTMLTGRPVAADPALPNTTQHGWTINGDVPPSVTLHNAGNPNLFYIASIFDVVHDHGLSTCLYSGKSKFSLFANSYNGKNGAPDRVGEDDGRNKIDRVVILDAATEMLVATLEGDLAGGVCDFAFLHIADPDSTGHGSGWGSATWLSTLDQVDAWLGRLAAYTDPSKTKDPFFLVVTADHGGEGYDHSNSTLPIDYTIPFFIVGPGIPAGADLYERSGRTDPADTRPRYSEPRQPVRNADAADLIARLLGLPPVPGAFMRDLLR